MRTPIFIKTMSGAALTELTGLKAHVKATPHIDFVCVWPGQRYVKSVFTAKNCRKDKKISFESLSKFLCVTGSDSDGG